MKNGLLVIITEIKNNDTEIISAVTYFEEGKQGYDTWFPTIITKIKSNNKTLEEMRKNKNFSGELEFKTIDDRVLNSSKVQDNKIIFEDKLTYIKDGSIKRTVGKFGFEKTMVAEESDKGCLDAMIACFDSNFQDLGFIGLAAYYSTWPSSYLEMMGECFIHEKACLGIPKPYVIIKNIII